jgi:hypothetical protein
MSVPLMSVVEGWTGALPFTLLADGSPVDLTGLTVHIVLKSADGTTVKDTTAGITLTASTAGQLEYAPSSSSGDLLLVSQTPYRVRFRVTDALSKKVYFPNDEEELIEVNPA